MKERLLAGRLVAVVVVGFVLTCVVVAPVPESESELESALILRGLLIRRVEERMVEGGGSFGFWGGGGERGGRRD